MALLQRAQQGRRLAGSWVPRWATGMTWLTVSGGLAAHIAGASLAIAAGVNAKALSTYLGHSSVAITLDRYGHLIPGNEAEAVALLDTYLDASAG